MQLIFANEKEFMKVKKQTKQQLTLKNFEMLAQTIEILHKKREKHLNRALKLCVGEFSK